jgi:hypothetical protein
MEFARLIVSSQWVTEVGRIGARTVNDGVFKVFVSVCVVVCCSRINPMRGCRTVRSPACIKLLIMGTDIKYSITTNNACCSSFGFTLLAATWNLNDKIIKIDNERKQMTLFIVFALCHPSRLPSCRHIADVRVTWHLASTCLLGDRGLVSPPHVLISTDQQRLSTDQR